MLAKERKRERERAGVRESREGRWMPLVGPTEALHWSSGRPLLSRFEGPGPWLVPRAANKNDKDGSSFYPLPEELDEGGGVRE